MARNGDGLFRHVGIWVFKYRDIWKFPQPGSLGNRVILTFQRHQPIPHGLAKLSRSSDFAPLLTPRT